ncbi:hypothetical protein [Acaryochloris marina]|uniref:Uncharacterized protein n=1 Tax=Acaryochloris marina (strain MBIC 11017) TaxID=329726 RepID=B0CCS9_ACAM1|nr:hypothetical protein [Acaryochloris marina]ABW29241.1 hypothetical protein AM1_4262 [Acaryochloris marina MBIC11017]
MAAAVSTDDAATDTQRQLLERSVNQQNSTNGIAKNSRSRYSSIYSDPEIGKDIDRVFGRDINRIYLSKWEKIRKILENSVLTNSFREKSKYLKEASKELKQLYENCVALVSKDVSDYLFSLSTESDVFSQALLGLSLIYESSRSNKRPVRKVKDLRDGMVMFSSIFPKFSQPLVEIGNGLEVLPIFEGLARAAIEDEELKNTTVRKKLDQVNLLKYVRDIKESAEEILYTTNRLKDQAGLKDWVLCRTDDLILYISPKSAEGKALQRIESIESGEEIEWEIIEPDYSFDMQEVREKIKARGYKVSPESSS